MKFYDLGELPWKQTQLVYHALGELGEEAVVICTPREKYVCVGFHQNPAQEFDLDYCKANDIGIFRREIGGGTVLLDSDQIFIQLIIDRKKAHLNQVVFFERFLQPVIETYRALGVEAGFIPICDLVVNGKKISGNGGGDVGKCKVATGSILLDFDVETMSRVLNLPSPAFRDRVLEAMEENMTTVKKELGHIPDRDEIRELLFSKWSDAFKELKKAELEQRVWDKADELSERFSSDEWLFKSKKRPGLRNIKIIEGINLLHYSSEGFEVFIELHGELIKNVEIKGSGSTDMVGYFKDRLVGEKFNDTLVLNTINAIQNGVLDGNK